MNPTTPDGRYFVVKGQLWRCSDPSLAADKRQLLVNQLMNARRQVKAAKARGDLEQLQSARADVNSAKVALGSVARCGGMMAAPTTTALKLPTHPMPSGTWRAVSRYH